MASFGFHFSFVVLSPLSFYELFKVQPLNYESF